MGTRGAACGGVALPAFSRASSPRRVGARGSRCQPSPSLRRRPRDLAQPGLPLLPPVPGLRGPATKPPMTACGRRGPSLGAPDPSVSGTYLRRAPLSCSCRTGSRALWASGRAFTYPARPEAGGGGGGWKVRRGGRPASVRPRRSEKYPRAGPHDDPVREELLSPTLQMRKLRHRGEVFAQGHALGRGRARS